MPGHCSALAAATHGCGSGPGAVAGRAAQRPPGLTQPQIAGNSFHEVDQICQLYGQARIKLRLYDAIHGPSPDVDRLLSEGPSLHGCADKLPVRSIKLYVDGALGSRGAALLGPYSDAPASSGLLVNTQEKLFPY
jgi:predicted amidohydrolase YtcJ